MLKIDNIRLNRSIAIQVRRKYLLLIALRARYPADAELGVPVNELFGYPDDVPDPRTRRPPGGDARDGSESSCHLARRKRGELPTVY